MTTPDVLDGAEIEKIVASFSDEQATMFLRYESGVAYGPCCPFGVTPGAKRGWARRDLIHVVHRSTTSFAADYALTTLGHAVRAHLARTRRVVDARSHGGEG